MKKLIDRIIERLYVKRFPERAGRFPLPDIIEINRKRLSTVKVCAEESWEKRYFPYDNIKEDDIRRYLMNNMKDNLIKYLKIETIDEPYADKIKFRGIITLLEEN